MVVMWFLRNRRGVVALAGVLLLSFFASLQSVGAQASKREKYLVELLQDSDSFRVRAQAALSLGKLRSSAYIQRGLRGALRDKSAAVRLSAASSLGLLGDPDAIPALRKARRDKDRKVRKQVRVAIATLREIKKSKGKSKRGDGDYYVVVGKPSGGRSLESSTRAALQTFVRAQLREEGGMVVAPKGEKIRTSARSARRRKLKAYHLEIGISDFARGADGVSAVVKITVSTVPGRAIVFVSTGKARVPGSRSDKAVRLVLESATKSAISPIRSTLDRVVE